MTRKMSWFLIALYHSSMFRTVCFNFHIVSFAGACLPVGRVISLGYFGANIFWDAMGVGVGVHC